MKQFYLLLVAIFSFFISEAQIIDIPDVNFKNALISTYCVDFDGNGSYDGDVDVNNDGEIQLSEALSVIGLRVYNESIISISGIESFLNLRSLKISNNSIVNLDIGQNVLLEELLCSGNNITTLDLSQNINLKILDCSYNNLTNLDVTQNADLINLDFDWNNITSINLNQNLNLETLYFPYNNISAIDVSNNPSLVLINCSSNSIVELDLNNNVNLSTLYANNNLLKRLFVKNGRTSMNLNFDNNPSLEFVCADLLKNIVQNRINQYGYSNVVVNGYCNFVPGGEYYTIKGESKVDLNLNGCDVTDVNYPNIKFNISEASFSGTYSFSTGVYNIVLQEGVYTLTPILENPNYWLTSPNQFEVNFPQDENPFIQNLCMTTNGDFNDLQIVILPLNQARPGFDAKYKIIYTNKGTTTLSGTVGFKYFHDNYVTFETSNPIADSHINNVLSWNYSNLQPFESRIIDLTFELNTPTDSEFPLNSGDLLSYNAQIYPLENDEEVTDNQFSIRQEVVNSLDPNDKICLQGEAIEPEMAGDYVHYLIRFENTGTADAINVVVKDIIDTSKFDISSLIPLSSSHSFVTRVQNTNKVEFFLKISIYLLMTLIMMVT